MTDEGANSFGEPSHSARRRVLVLDGDTRTALAVTRSLGRAGWPVCVAAGRTDDAARLAQRATDANPLAIEPLFTRSD